MSTVSFCTLGCKVNQYETEAMTNLFAEAGYTIKEFGEKCDIYVINTCTVTGTGDRKSRQMIHRAKKANPDAIIAVVGCYSQIAPDEVKKIDGVSLVLGTNDRCRIVELTEKAMREKKQTVSVGDIMKSRSYEDMWVSSYASRTRAFVKIEDGCTEFCTYCIIPYARGPVRSRSLESIGREVKALAKNGFKEIVLTGIHIASYGKDTKNSTLLDVIRLVGSVDGIERIRLGSLEPRILTESFIEGIKEEKKVCNHFHISLQSGCNETLRRMNRKYDTAEYEKSVELLRKYFYKPAIATDIMVGFPGETDEEFEASLEFMKKIRFADAHVFVYSNRKGTKADTFSGQVDKHVKEERARRMSNCVNELKKQYLKSHIGTAAEVLAEHETSPGVYEGHTTDYIKVLINSEKDISKSIVRVQLTEEKNGVLLGEIKI